MRLQRSGSLQQIGSVSVNSSPARASREIGQDDALRFLDGSLRDALGDVPGVTASGDGLAIDGNDPSQTGTTVDGVRFRAWAGRCRARHQRRLVRRREVSSGAANGALGRRASIPHAQPTRFAQQQATLQYDSAIVLRAVVARGSVRISATFRIRVARANSPLTGAEFVDETGPRVPP